MRPRAELCIREMESRLRNDITSVLKATRRSKTVETQRDGTVHGDQEEIHLNDETDRQWLGEEYVASRVVASMGEK